MKNIAQKVAGPLRVTDFQTAVKPEQMRRCFQCKRKFKGLKTVTKVKLCSSEKGQSTKKKKRPLYYGRCVPQGFYRHKDLTVALKVKVCHRKVT